MSTNDWDEDEVQPIQLIAVCHTPGCIMENEECVGSFYPVGNFNPPRYLGGCGQCGKQYTDLRPVPDPTPVEPTPEPPPTEPVEPVPVDPTPVTEPTEDPGTNSETGPAAA